MLLVKRLYLALLASSVAVLWLATISVAQGNSTLLAGQTLPQGQALSSPDGRCYLVAQSDGNLVLYLSQVVALYQPAFYSAIFATGTYGASPQPFSLVMQEDCNLVLLSGSGQTIYSSKTANQGSRPCRLVVSGAGGGGFAVLDSQNATLFSEGAYSPPGTLPGTLPSGTALKQNVKLFSADATVCLIAQSDGNLVLYNVALLRTYGSATAASAIWDSGTDGTGSAPFTLALQPDCNLLLLSSTNQVVYTSGAAGEGSPPCLLTVSSQGGGFIRVTASAYITLYVQPPAFQIMLDGGFKQPPGTSDIVGYNNQIYDAPTGSVFQTASSALQLFQPEIRTYLPVTNSILGCGRIQGYSPTANAKAGCEVFSPTTGNWTATGQLNMRSRDRFGMISLNDGSALVVGGIGVVNFENQVLTSCETYYPPTGIWTPAGSLAFPREYVQLARLPSGQVVTAGSNFGGGDASTEVFNPFTRYWTTAASMSVPRQYHQLITLDDGRVLAVGGTTGTIFFNPSRPVDSGSDQILSSCEIFDIAAGTWTATGSMATGRYLHRATLLASGRVLATGGIANATAPGSSQLTKTLASTEIYDPVSGTWSPGPDMPVARSGHEQITLPSGRVFVSSDADGFILSSLLFDEHANTFSNTSSLVDPDLSKFGVLFRG